MKKLHGVHLAHHKNTENSASVPLPLPKLVRIPMSMHIGAPCTPLVKPRDTVLVGQKIGDTDAFMAVPIHSGVSGKVKAVSTYRMSNGRTCPMVEIETDGEQTVSPDVCPPAVTDKESFLKAVRESGLVGMGGASFPTHVKLNPKQTVDTLVINAAECEPYITSDYRQMIEAPDEVLDGDAVGKPCNVMVPMGTPVQDVLDFAQCDMERAKKVLYGGPMMGIAVPDTADPILKANNAVLALEKFVSPKPTACIHCGRCVHACPLRLMPTEIAKAFRQEDSEALGKLKVTLCMNCGCCTYACPAKRPVAETNQLAKAFYMSSIKK